ncbi:MAG: radical SAM protein [Candidatus Omnitrophota bacterium]
MKRVPNAPFTVQLILTRRCNLACSYCSAAHFLDHETEPELNTEEWISVLRRLKEIGVFTIEFTGGEVLVRDDFFEILEAAVACRFSKISLLTNGTLVTETVAAELKRLGIKTISISLDGDKESHDRLRGTGSYEKTMAGIRHLLDHGIIPTIAFTPLKQNVKSLEKLAQDLHPLGIKEIVTNSLHPSGRCKSTYSEIKLDLWTDVKPFSEMVNELNKQYPGLKIRSVNTSYLSFPSDYNRVKDHLSAHKLKPCSAGHSTCNITSGGWVIPCSELSDFKGGNIRETDISVIWKESEVFKEIRALSEITTADIDYCRNCQFNIFCCAGCRADAYLIYGNLLAPDPFCPYWREK